MIFKNNCVFVDIGNVVNAAKDWFLGDFELAVSEIEKKFPGKKVFLMQG